MLLYGLILGQPLSNIDIGELYDCPCDEIFSIYMNDGKCTVNCFDGSSYQFVGNDFLLMQDRLDFEGQVRYYYPIHPEVNAIGGHEFWALEIKDSIMYISNDPFVVPKESNEQHLTILDFPNKYRISLDDLSRDTFLIPYQKSKGLENIDFTKENFNARYEGDSLILFSKKKYYTLYNGVLSESSEFYSSWEFFSKLNPEIYYLNPIKTNFTKTKQFISPENVLSFGIHGKRDKLFTDSVEYFVIVHKEEAHLQKLGLDDEESSLVGTWESGHSYWFDYDQPEVLFCSDNSSCKLIYKDILSYTQKELGQTKTIHALYEVNGNMMIGMYGKGLQALDNRPLNYEYALAKDVNKVLSGSIEYEGKTYGINESYSCIHYFDKSMNDLHTLSLVVDNKPTRRSGYYLDTLRDGRLAIGMERNGLGILDSMDAKHFYVRSIGEKKGLGLGNVLGFEQDASGNIWMGRPSKGVAVYSSRRDTVYNFLRSEYERNIGALSFEIDHRENMWLAGHNGLYYLESPADFNPIIFELLTLIL